MTDLDEDSPRANIPAGWLPAGHGPGCPDEALQAPPEGIVVDHWLLP